jgi:hypothetical protein
VKKKRVVEKKKKEEGRARAQVSQKNLFGLCGTRRG